MWFQNVKRCWAWFPFPPPHLYFAPPPLHSAPPWVLHRSVTLPSGLWLVWPVRIISRSEGGYICTYVLRSALAGPQECLRHGSHFCLGPFHVAALPSISGGFASSLACEVWDGQGLFFTPPRYCMTPCNFLMLHPHFTPSPFMKHAMNYSVEHIGYFLLGP